jgi:hypothetical protein
LRIGADTAEKPCLAVGFVRDHPRHPWLKSPLNARIAGSFFKIRVAGNFDHDAANRPRPTHRINTE